MMRKTPLILLTAAALPFAAQAVSTDFSYGGFIKADAMFSQYKDAKIGGLDYYNPSKTPIEGAGDSVNAFDTSAKASRFNFKTVTTLDNGEKVTAFVELDFLGGGGNQLVSNSYNPRLRHAFFKYNNLTIGQTWSTFMNVGALPESVDFIGPSEGTVFSRQVQVRYDIGDFQIALENSETNVGAGMPLDSNGEDTLNGAQSSAIMPDVIARYNINAGEHSFSVAAMLRDLRTENIGGNDESSMGFGLNAAGVLKLGNDNLKFSASYGQIGRYVGLSTAADAIIAGGDLEATDVLAAFVSYQHFWSSNLRSSLTYSMLDASYDNDTVAAGLNESSQSARVNLLYSPVSSITYGVELSNAKLEKVNGADDGSFNRLHFTAKYAF